MICDMKIGKKKNGRKKENLIFTGKKTTMNDHTEWMNEWYP